MKRILNDDVEREKNKSSTFVFSSRGVSKGSVRIFIIGGAVAAFILGVLVLQFNPATSTIIWNASNGGVWLLPLVLASSLLDSVHPCSFSILLITIAFLFGLQLSRQKIMQIGGVYIAGIFAAYLAIGLGALKVLHLFNTPHFMGKLGASLLIVFGIVTLLNRFFPNMPVKLKMPSMVHRPMAKLLERTSIAAAFGLGILVGICQFPCMGGPYLMVIGLLRDQVTYLSGFWYLLLYNVILIVPLVLVLWFSSDKTVVDKMQEWKRDHLAQVRLIAGIAMILLGALILLV
ncbi:MAG: cytochrome c biogenesis protein CcdA [Patescibacteria group bacterium]